MLYRHQFVVHAPQSVVAAFHSRADSMGAITPPPVIVRIHAAPAILDDGDAMDFTMWMGPLPIHWVARIEEKTAVSFVDRQLSGPFESWAHLHTYVPASSGAGLAETIVVDQVTAELSRHWFWRWVGLGMWLSLPILFAYRGWQTRRLLEHGQATEIVQ